MYSKNDKSIQLQTTVNQLYGNCKKYSNGEVNTFKNSISYTRPSRKCYTKVKIDLILLIASVNWLNFQFEYSIQIP